MRFDPLRESRFIDMDAQVLSVEYGKEKRTETLPNGLVCTFDRKVRLHLPQGKTVVLYQAIAKTGVRYLSKDKRYEFVEKGPYCMVTCDGKPAFEGFFCRK
jgi:membrane-bound inhibitor of C-type lysozyme